VRIIAGVAKGNLLYTPKGKKTRFTSDKVRGALFNILGQDLTGRTFLDLFAGVGSVGIEALSRGAAPVVFVEENRSNVRYIWKNLENCSLAQNTKIYNLSFKQALRRLPRDYFDFVYLDPPYSLYSIENILHDLLKRDIIQPSITIIEHKKKDVIPDGLKDLNLIRQKVYGQTILSFYKKIR